MFYGAVVANVDFQAPPNLKFDFVSASSPHTLEFLFLEEDNDDDDDDDDYDDDDDDDDDADGG